MFILYSMFNSNEHTISIEHLVESHISYITFTKSAIVRFAAKPLDKGNSGADTCRVQALRVLGKKFPKEIFRRKKRAGIAVRVGERAWDLAAKPTDDAYYRNK